MNIAVSRKALTEISLTLFASAMISMAGAVVADTIIKGMAHHLESNELGDTNGHFVSAMRIAWLMFVGGHSMASISCAAWLYIIQKRGKMLSV